jgi:hypothetical protein
MWPVLYEYTLFCFMEESSNADNESLIAGDPPAGSSAVAMVALTDGLVATRSGAPSPSSMGIPLTGLPVLGSIIFPELPGMLVEERP